MSGRRGLSSPRRRQLGLTVVVHDIVYDPPRPDRPSSVAVKIHAQVVTADDSMHSSLISDFSRPIERGQSGLQERNC